MNKVFRSGKEKTESRYEYRARVLTKPERKIYLSLIRFNLVKLLNELQSFQLNLLRFEQRWLNLVVITPRRFPRLAKSQNTGVQTIPFNGEGL